MRKNIVQKSLCIGISAALVTLFAISTGWGGSQRILDRVLEIYGTYDYVADIVFDSDLNMHLTWSEVEEKVIDEFTRLPTWHAYYEKRDNNGNPLVSKKEMGRPWPHIHGPRISLGPNGKVWLSDVYGTTGTSLHAVVVDSLGNEIDRFTFMSVGRMRPHVDRDGTYHILFASGAEMALRAGPIYGNRTLEGGKHRVELGYSVTIGDAVYPLSGNSSLISTSDGNVLVSVHVLRGGEGKGEVVYLKLNVEGKIVSGPQAFRVDDAAFRKIEGVDLPRLELTSLPDKQIILSVTVSDEGENQSVYQIRFSENGELMPAANCESLSPLSLTELPEGFPPQVQVAYRSKYKDRIPEGCDLTYWKDLYIFGFDGDGKLYYWKEWMK